ncbi:MFS transporter [Brevibacillus fulvus]|uniref:ACDE family multidrug resistance protein n=1 Tax=Brevibacillus fulvus TaxID=1125967 RepID=A0A938XS51_9BACL|nr:MFS transporter [Brevibacillus fulvus]MBM7589343.1 ACDE family multidrug resistance protein [Brevibacillus fulvus]
MAQSTKNLVGLTGVPLVMVLGNSMLIPVLPTMKGELDLTSFQTSFLITAFSISAGLVIPFAGYLSDRFNRKVVITIALALYGIGGLLAGLASLWLDQPYGVIMAGRVLQGIGAAGTAPIALALVGDLFNGASESRALGLMETSNGLGKVLSPIVGSLLALIAWYMVFLAFPIICGAVLLLFFFMVKEKKQQKKAMEVKQYLHSIKQVFHQHGRWLVPAFFIGTICLFTLFGVLVYLSDLLEDKYKIDGVKKGLFLAIPLLTMSITAYITGIVIKKKLNLMRAFVIIGMIMLAVSYFIASFVQGAYLLIGVLLIGSVGTGIILPCLNSMIVGSVKKTERGMITSLYSGVRFVGVAIGPPIFTWLEGISRNVMFYSIAGLSLLFAIVAFIWLKPQQTQAHQSKQGAAAKQGEQADEAEIESAGLKQVAEILQIKTESPEEKQQRQAKEKLGFDADGLVEHLLRGGKKEKGK